MDHIDRFGRFSDDCRSKFADSRVGNWRKTRQLFLPQLVLVWTSNFGERREVPVNNEHFDDVSQTFAQQSHAIEYRLEEFGRNDQPELLHRWRFGPLRDAPEPQER